MPHDNAASSVSAKPSSGRLAPLAVGRRLELRIGTRAVAVRIAAIVHALDLDRLKAVMDRVGNVTIFLSEGAGLDTIVAEMEQSGELWRQLRTSGGIAIHAAGEFPGLQVELWAIRG